MSRANYLFRADLLLALLVQIPRVQPLRPTSVTITTRATPFGHWALVVHGVGSMDPGQLGNLVALADEFKATWSYVNNEMGERELLIIPRPYL